MGNVAIDKETMSIAAAILCISLMMGVVDAPIVQGSYYLDHGSLPSMSKIIEWWKSEIFNFIAGILPSTAWKVAKDIASAIVSTYNYFTTGEIVQGSYAVLAAWHDVIVDVLEKYGLRTGWWIIAYEVAKFAFWM